MLKITQFYRAVVIGGLLFNSMQGMSLSSVVKKLIDNHQVKPRLLTQSKDFHSISCAPSKFATKFILIRCQAKNVISKHLDNIENTQNLKHKLAETTYAPIIFDLEASFNKVTPPEAWHLAKESGQITNLAAKFVKLKSLASRLQDCRNIGSFCSLLKDSCQSFNSSEAHQNVHAISTAEKLSLLDEALTKIDLQLIQNLGYEDHIFAESTATIIRAKLKTKLMAHQELSEADLSLLISQIAELINFDYINHVEQKYEGRLTFPVFLNIESASVKDAKISAIENEINHYQDALKFIISTRLVILEAAQIQTQPITNELWLSIEKKVSDRLCEEHAKMEFAKLSPQEQIMLKDKFADSTTHQLLVSNKLLSLTHKLDQWSAGQFKFSDLWSVTSNAYQLYNLQQPNEADRLKADINLWLTCFREQLATTY
jgi:hypothetical protein